MILITYFAIVVVHSLANEGVPTVFGFQHPVVAREKCPWSILNRSQQRNAEESRVLGHWMGTKPMRAASIDDTSVGEERERAKLGRVPIISRKIPVEIEMPAEPLQNKTNEFIKKRLDITVWEMEKPSELIQAWWTFDESERKATGDPFGTVMWPGSILASMELMHQHYKQHEVSPFEDATVLILGAGTGVEAQTAALLGAKKVIATDINQLTLKLLDYGAKRMAEKSQSVMGNAVDGIVEAKFFDLFSDLPLPESDIIVAADVLYNEELASQVGRRIFEAISRTDLPTKLSSSINVPKIIVSDSQKFHGTNFLEELPEMKALNSKFEENEIQPLQWEMRQLRQVRGSGVLIDEDQTYDVDVRMIRWGWT